MKQTLTSVTILLGIILLHWQCGQESSKKLATVPNQVLMKFRSQFPESGKESWKSTNRGLYVANFKEGNLSVEVVYNDQGEWLQTEEALKRTDLPLPVVYAIEHGNYGNYEVESFELRSFPDQPNEFVAELSNDVIEMEVSFDEEGQLVRRRSKKRITNS